MSSRTITVGNALQLVAAVRSARAGDTILVAGGHYGFVHLMHANPAAAVTIRPLDVNDPVTFTRLNISNSSNLVLQDFNVENQPVEGARTPQAMQINGSSNITVTGFAITGAPIADQGTGITISGGRGNSILDTVFYNVRATTVLSNTGGAVLQGLSRGEDAFAVQAETPPSGSGQVTAQPPASGPRTLTVNNGSELITTLRGARGGDTILLAGGNYGFAHIANINPDSLVTIRPADTEAAVTFTRLNISRSSNLALEGFIVHNEPDGSRAQAMQINAASNITISGFTVQGSLNGSAHDDAHGLQINGGSNIAVLDSQFQQLHGAIVLSRTSNVIVAGNTITEVREGVNMSMVTNGLFERNLLHDFDPKRNDHADYFQVHAALNNTGSSNLIFRDNVMVQGTSGPVGGVFIRSENIGQGVRHSNILIENNFYEGTYRHALSVSDTVGATVVGNTVLDSNRAGNSAAILNFNTQNMRVDNNIAPLFLHPTNSSTYVSQANNIDVIDPRFGGVVTREQLFDRAFGALDAQSMTPLVGSLADLNGAGFRARVDAGRLDGTLEQQLAHYGALFEQIPALVQLV
jgi:preprotein translocase subunit YajC